MRSVELNFDLRNNASLKRSVAGETTLVRMTLALVGHAQRKPTFLELAVRHIKVSL